MNLFEKILLALQTEMVAPEPWGWFHLLWLSFMCVAIVFLYHCKDTHGEKQLKTVLGTYSIIALVLEIAKQIVWSFNYDITTGLTFWDYQWYAAPFQLCTTPIYACLISLFFDKENRLRKSLLSYVAFTTILGSIATIFMPDSCFTKTILVNIHTMWLHYGSFVVSIYLLMSGVVKVNPQNLRKAFVTFVIFVCIATVMNIGVYQSGVLNGEEFNMFYISPYFISSLPVFNMIQQGSPYPVFLATYIVALGIGSTIIYGLSELVQHRKIVVSKAKSYVEKIIS